MTPLAHSHSLAVDSARLRHRSCTCRAGFSHFFPSVGFERVEPAETRLARINDM